MAHFAQLDENNTVVNVVVVDNGDIQNLAFPDSESVGQEFLSGIFPGTRWVQTSYNNNFRKRYAGIGSTFYAALDGFCPPKEYPSFVFDAATVQFTPPKAYPTDGAEYKWVEEALDWVVIQVGKTQIGA